MKKTISIFIMMFILSITNITFASPNWVLICSTDTTTYELDFNSICNLASDKFTIWTRETYTSEKVQELIKFKVEKSEPIDGYENLSYSKKEFIFTNKHGSKMYFMKSSIYYDLNDKILDSYNFNDTVLPYKEIISGSTGETIFDVAYTYLKK